MPSATSFPADDVRAATSTRSNPARWLYSGLAALMIVITFLGFQQFYLHGRAYPAHPIPPPVKPLLILHGMLMTGWIALFMLQPLLVATGNRRKHMALGVVGACLAAAMIIVGLYAPIATARAEPDITLWGLNRLHFTAIPMLSILTFGAFVAVGLWNRRRPDIHRPMMALGTLAIIAAASDRITGLPDLYATTVWGRIFGPYAIPLLIGALFLVLKTAVARSFDRWYAGGYVALAAICAAIMRVAPTHAWERTAAWLMK